MEEKNGSVKLSWFFEHKFWSFSGILIKRYALEHIKTALVTLKDINFQIS